MSTAQVQGVLAVLFLVIAVCTFLLQGKQWPTFISACLFGMFFAANRLGLRPHDVGTRLGHRHLPGGVMTRPTPQQVIVRTWEIGPTLTEACALAVVDAALIFFWGASWWLTFGATLLGCVVIFGTLAWLDLHNEAADEAARTDSDDEAG